MAKKGKLALQVSIHTGKGAMSSGSYAPAPGQPQESEEDKVRQGGYHLDDLMRAEEIKQDPQKMKYAMKAHAKKFGAIKNIQDLKDAYEAKFGAGREKESAAEDKSEPKNAESMEAKMIAAKEGRMAKKGGM